MRLGACTKVETKNLNIPKVIGAFGLYHRAAKFKPTPATQKIFWNVVVNIFSISNKFHKHNRLVAASRKRHPIATNLI